MIQSRSHLRTGILAGALLLTGIAASAQAAPRPQWDRVGQWTTPGQTTAVNDAGTIVYSGDYLGEHIRRTTAKGKVTGQWSDAASGLDVDRTGSVWAVGDFSIRHYSLTGHLLATIGDDPYHDVATRDGRAIYTIQATTGSVAVERWTSDGTKTAEHALVSPIAVAVDTKGMVYVADSAAEEVLRFTPDLKPAGSFDLPRSPRGLAIDGRNRVYVTFGDRTVGVYNIRGARIANVTTRARNAKLGPIDVTSNGRIYATDRNTSGTSTRVTVMGTASTPVVVSPRIKANGPRTAARIRISCRNGETYCTGKLTLRAGKQVLGTRTYALALRTSRMVTVRLTAAARARLARARQVGVIVTLTPTVGQKGARRVVLAR